VKPSESALLFSLHEVSSLDFAVAGPECLRNLHPVSHRSCINFVPVTSCFALSKSVHMSELCVPKVKSSRLRTNQEISAELKLPPVTPRDANPMLSSEV